MSELPRRVRPGDAQRKYIEAKRRLGGDIGGSRWARWVAGSAAQQAAVRGGAALTQPVARSSWIDQFTVASTATLTYVTTYLPIFDSWNVSINGVTQYDTTDYTVTGQDLTFASSALLRVGDLIEIQYDYLVGVPSSVAPPEPPIVHAQGGYYSSTPSLPAAAAAGDLLVALLFIDNAATVSTLNGYTVHAVSSSVTQGGFTYKMHVLSRIMPGVGTPAPVFDFTGLSGACEILAIPGYTSVDSATVGTQASGTTALSPAAVAQIRAWGAINGFGSLNAAPVGTVQLNIAGDIDLEVTTDNSTSAVTVTSTTSAAWAMAALEIS